MSIVINRYKTEQIYSLIAGIVIVLAGIIMVCLWRINPEFRGIYVGESFVDSNQFIPGANFERFGFMKLHFTADYAVGQESYHPFYYTHNPPLSEIINGLYHKFGLTQIKSQRFICIMWTLLSLFMFYKLFRILISGGVGLCCLIILISNPYYLYFGDNLFAGLQWVLVYASLFFLLKYIKTNSLLYSVMAWLTFFCASFYNYEVIPMIGIFVLGLKILKLECISWRHVYIYTSAFLFSFFVRNMLIVWSMGWNIWFCDLIETLLHRTLAVKTALINIYDNVSIVMWNTDPVIPHRYLVLLYHRLESIYGYGWGIILVFLSFKGLRNYLLPRSHRVRLNRLIWLFFFMGIAWYFTFPQHTANHFHSVTMLLFGPFACLLWSISLFGLWENIKGKFVKFCCLSVIVLSVISARIFNFTPFHPFPGINALKKYKGKVFVTNCIPTLVEYYTGAPAAFCDSLKRAKAFISGEYYFFLRGDKVVLPIPEFFFSVYEWDGQEIATDSLPLVEKGRDYAIYRIDSRGER